MRVSIDLDFTTIKLKISIRVLRLSIDDKLR